MTNPDEINWAKMGKILRKVCKPNDESYLMFEGELTEKQRESLEPIGTKGYYRMYRWVCDKCDEVGRKMPYSSMKIDAVKHIEEKNHRPNAGRIMREEGGVFPKEELYKY